MGKFDGILICTDLDGTLLNAEHKVSEENARAIEYFKSEGGFFTFITGRPHYTARAAYEMVKPNVPFGCVNGGGIYDMKKGEYVFHRELDKSVLSLVEYVIERVPDIAVHIYTPHVTYFSRVNEASEIYAKIVGIDIVKKDMYEIEEPISKIIFAHMDENVVDEAARAAEDYPDADKFGFIRSERNLTDVLPKENSKGNLLLELAKYLGVDVKNTVAVGDYNNDVSMIKAAGIGYAVENAIPEAKAAADRITVKNTEHAIAKIIEDLDYHFTFSDNNAIIYEVRVKR